MEGTSSITIANRDEMFVIHLDTVAYFRAEGHYSTVFYLSGARLLVPCGLSKVREKIQSVAGGYGDAFLPMGRSLLVNRHAVCCLNSAKETMLLHGTGGQIISVHVPKSVIRSVMPDFGF